VSCDRVVIERILPKPQEWIRVEDALPESLKGSIYSDTVLSFDENEENYFLAVYVPKFNSWHEDDEAPEGKLSRITHWMPLPKAPEGE